MKVKDVHDHAFDASKDVLEELFISGPGMADETNELEYFPIYMLEDFPNLKHLSLQMTDLKDDTFILISCICRILSLWLSTEVN